MKTRDDRPSFAQSCRLNLLSLWLLMACILAGPGYAFAEVQTCTDWNGQQPDVKINLPPSVSFSPGVTPDLNRPLYTSPEYSINYKCTNTSGRQAQVSITRLGDFSPLTTALKGAGMQLKFRIRDSSNGQEVSWNPIGSDEHISIGTYYTGTTINRTAYITVELYLASIPKAGFYAVPSLTSFKFVPFYGSFSGFFLTTDTTRIQYVPTCFVKTSLNTNKVDFGPVLTSDIDSSLSIPRFFTVGASVNSSSGCDTGNLQKQYEVVTTSGKKYYFYLNLPLKVTFSIASGGTPSSDNSSIILKNENDEDNGLQLKISDPAGNYVTFGDVLQPENHPANQLGEFDKGIFTVNKQYTATLSSTGKQVKTGKYNAQITVKVSYY
ncbi:fimbrial protein [Salmonella enterica]